jgi:hypothetical protein
MALEISEDTKKKIFTLISIPGIEIEDISKDLDIEYDKLMQILSDEYLKHNFDYGRRLCCRF